MYFLVVFLLLGFWILEDIHGNYMAKLHGGKCNFRHGPARAPPPAICRPPKTAIPGDHGVRIMRLCCLSKASSTSYQS
jgi:hypothetical protein